MQNHNEEKSEWIHVIKEKVYSTIWPNALSLNAVVKNLALNPSPHEISLVSISSNSHSNSHQGILQQMYQAEVIQKREGKTAERGEQVEKNSVNTHFSTCLIMNLSNSLNLGILLYFANILYYMYN